MKNRFSIFTSVAVAAVLCASITVSVANDPLPAANSPTAAEVFGRAKQRLQTYSSVTARVRHRTHAFGKSLVGAGEYQQGTANSRLMRFEITSATSAGPSFLQQVADGKYLWIHRQVPDGSSIQRIELAQVEAFENARSVSLAPAEAMASIARGGLPRLLQNLQRSFDFQPAMRARLDTLQGYAVQGVWTMAMLKQIAPEQSVALDEGKPFVWKKILPHIPDRVSVFFGRDDYFPYQIKFERLNKKLDPPVVEPLSTIEFIDVRLNGKLDPSLFRFNAAPGAWTDTTLLYLKSLH